MASNPWRHPDEELTVASLLRHEGEARERATFLCSLRRSSTHPRAVIAATSVGVLVALGTFAVGLLGMLVLRGVSWGLPMAPVVAVVALFLGAVASVVVALQRRGARRTGTG